MSTKLTELTKRNKMLFCPFCGEELPYHDWSGEINENYMDRVVVCVNCKIELMESIDGEINLDDTIKTVVKWLINIKPASDTQLKAYTSDNENESKVDMLKNHRTLKNIVKEL